MVRLYRIVHSKVLVVVATAAGGDQINNHTCVNCQIINNNTECNKIKK